ncbi:FUSC family protein [Paractinoplanes rishiriensis]|uniref:FUSC family protein n=1 Tax=Paractinoplanes rishiriensis TaxID=1050105 RepID=A0A919MV09_9ACTN|nr:FUSC family protein [Actinoplanes rishiriensis]GIF00897.1 FUSC family protein [Actinoplanes rishiriensis]
MVWTRSQRWIRAVWPLAQQSAAAVVAWLIAVRVAGHADPFFAPIAAVVGLNATLGQRGSNAVRLVSGVVIGVLVGEVAVWLAGGGVRTLAVATFTAILLARVVDGARIVLAQAAVSVILVVVLVHPERGGDRMVDAVIGAAVALAFSQVLFTPEPLRLLRRAEAAVLSSLADGLRMTGDAVEHGDQQRAMAATVKLRSVRDDLTALGTARSASDRITRHGLAWRRRAALVVAERAGADHLDLLAGSCLMLTRTATAVDGPERARLAAVIRHLAGAMDEVAENPGGQDTRQNMAEDGVELAMWLVEHGARVSAQSALAAAQGSVRMVAADVMVFAGADPGLVFTDPIPARPDE